jgi:hypothetical protein
MCTKLQTTSLLVRACMVVQVLAAHGCKRPRGCVSCVHVPNLLPELLTLLFNVVRPPTLVFLHSLDHTHTRLTWFPHSK